MTPFPQAPLGDAERQFRLLVENVRDYALFFTDLERRVVTWNAGAERMMGWTGAEMIGQSADIIFVPEDRATGEPDKEAGKALREGRAENERWHLKRDGSRFWGSGILTALKDENGNLLGFCKIFRDLTERKEREERLRRQAALVELAYEAILVTDLNNVILFWNRAAEELYGWPRAEAVGMVARELLGTEFPESFESVRATLETTGRWEGELVHTCRSGNKIVVASRWSLQRDEQNKPAAVLAVNRDITERKRAEAERQSAYERERLINQIGQAIRATLDPEEIQARAVSALGEALHADRCGLVLVDAARDHLEVLRDWHRPDLPRLSGTYRISEFAVDLHEFFGRERTFVVEDTQQGPWSEVTAAAFARMRVRALINVPFYEDGNLVAVLSVSVADAPRAWTADEVMLVEAVATEARTAVEAARMLRHEQTIAYQLQAALQPPLPETVPGLLLAQHHHAALDEAKVGGDFFDVYSIGKGCTALVVGDLSGKGLAAAAQVATVRNMLRFALYNESTLVEAATALNRTLVENNLIEGFATLFLGAYDCGAQTLAYVNCGQEPALVRRASTGVVEELGSTGPVLGSMVDADFEAQVVSLSAGDALAVFTDGLPEAGPSRTNMIGVAGIAALLAQHSREESAPFLAQRLVAGVDAHSRGGIRDDVCLLVGIVKDTCT